MEKARKRKKTWEPFLKLMCVLFSLYVSLTVAVKYLGPDGFDGTFKAMYIDPHGLPGIFWAMIFGFVSGIVVALFMGQLMGIIVLGFIMFPLSTMANAIVTTIIIAVLSWLRLPEWFSLITSLITGTWVGATILYQVFDD